MTSGEANEVIRAMRASLRDYDVTSNVLSLDRLVSFLSGAIDAIDGLVDGAWLQELRSSWWPLEYVNANVLSDDRRVLTSNEIESVTAAREELLGMLKEY